MAEVDPDVMLRELAETSSTTSSERSRFPPSASTFDLSSK